MDPAILFFFEKDPAVLALYEAFETAVNALVPDVGIKVRKTQITYTNPRVFAAVSFLPARRKALRPEHYITVTLGLNRRLDSPRVDAFSEPYPARWTHHLTISSAEEIDGELFLTVPHEMSKAHYISFIAYVTTGRSDLVKLYPEGQPGARFYPRGSGWLYWYCNRHGLFRERLGPERIRRGSVPASPKEGEGPTA